MKTTEKPNNMSGYCSVLNKRFCLNKRAPSTFGWNLPLKTGEKGKKNEQKWLKNFYIVPLGPLAPTRCPSSCRERLFSMIW